MLELLARCVCVLVALCLIIYAMVLFSGAAKNMDRSKPEDGEAEKVWDIGKQRRLKQLHLQLVTDALFLAGIGRHSSVLPSQADLSTNHG